MENISKSIAGWYSQHKRDLPWRNTNDPYLIWVSEIILQQTRIDQGIAYYYRFTKTFPNIFSLAKANIDEILKIWQGLGYYSRARNMHHTAKVIVKELNGLFPNNFDELIQLKGIGDYTAAAIASFSFNQVVPVVDGNVFRFIARFYGMYESTQTAKGKKLFYNKAFEIIDKENPAEFNQAIMEFGSLQCTPANPDCNTCIFKLSCFAYNNNSINELPIKKQKVKQRNRYFNYLYIIYKEQTFIQKRKDDDIWKLLYQFPLIETDSKISDEEILNNTTWNQIFEDVTYKLHIPIIEKKHILSHQKLYTRFFKIEIFNTNKYLDENYLQIQINKMNKYSIPRLIDSYLEDVNK